MDSNQPFPFSDLSRRELQVLSELSSGISREKVADHLGISVLTYDSYRKSIRAKLKIKSQLDWGKVLVQFQNYQIT